MKRDLVVVDIDGTIADDSPRWLKYRPHEAPNKALHDEAMELYYAEIPNDAAMHGAMPFLLSMRRYGFEIVASTGRPERFRRQTEQWLVAQFSQRCAPSTVFMRGPEHDGLRNPEVKAAHAKLIGPERVALWVDDHPDVPAFLTPLGIPVLSLTNPSAAWNQETTR